MGGNELRELREQAQELVDVMELFKALIEREHWDAFDQLAETLKAKTQALMATKWAVVGRA